MARSGILTRMERDASPSRSWLLFPALISIIYFLLHMWTATRYGYFRDALYYLACSEHMDWGYVDQPPLIVFIAWISRHTLGTSLRALIFWPRFAWETLSKHAVIIATITRLLVLKLVIMRDPSARTYRDTALTPVSDDEEMTLNLLTNTTGAHAAVTHLKKIARLTGVARSV